MVSLMSLPKCRQLQLVPKTIESASEGPISAIPYVRFALDHYLRHFCDWFPAESDERTLTDLNKTLLALAEKETFEDFENDAAWEELRILTRRMLTRAGIEACGVPDPLPLLDWIDDDHYIGWERVFGGS